ncbi:MAG: HNH endonuclease [Brasilonema sp.]
MTIPNSIQALIRQRANFRCEYCHYPEFLSTSPLTIDHIMPKSLGGSDDADNLALACRRCNEQTNVLPKESQRGLGKEYCLLGECAKAHAAR